MIEYKVREKCAICKNKELKSVVDYGDVPLAGFFPKKEELNDIKKYHLILQYCPECHLMQTNSVIDPNILFKDYRYMSSVSLQKHFNDYAKYLVDNFKLDNTSKVLEMGSNDGVLLKPLIELGINSIGIDPSVNISQLAIDKGCDVIVDFFNYEKAIELFNEKSFDLITSSNSFAHIDDIQSVVRGIKYCLKDNGYFIFEVHYGKNIIEGMQYDNVYHEHIYYYTLHSLNNLFKDYDMGIVDVEEISLHSGSIRVTVKNNQLSQNNKIITKLQEEKKIGIDSVDYYSKFQKLVYKHRNDFINLLNKLKSEGNNIGAYGASGRANILCNFADINNNIVDYIIDESPERNGRYINNIPILDKEHIDSDSDYIVIFAWNYSKMIISKLEDAGYDFKYIIPFPEINIVSGLKEIENINTY